MASLSIASRLTTSHTNSKIQVCLPVAEFRTVYSSRLLFEVLQYHYNILAAIALQEDTPRAEDSTFPEAEAVAGRIAKYVPKINEEVSAHPLLNDHSWRLAGLGESFTAVSGAGEEGGDENAAKKIKVSKERASTDVKLLEKTLKKAFEDGTSGKITNDKYKDYLKQKGHKSISSMKKSELIRAANEQLAKDGIIAAEMDDDDDA